MENPGIQDRLFEFHQSGIYHFDNSTAVFIDPVRVLNRSYSRFTVSPSAYYSRFFEDSGDKPVQKQIEGSRKRKRKKEKQLHPLTETEQIAEQRHQKARPFLLRAHEALLEATELLGVLRNLRNDEFTEEGSLQKMENDDLDFVQLGSVWQAPLCEICLHLDQDNVPAEEGAVGLVPCSEGMSMPVFNNLVMNESANDVEAEILNHRYIMPKKSCFYMSDLRDIHNLVPAESDCGFNLILIDPPWENSSAHQKLKYQTLPNRHFLSLPIKQLTHTGGALVALWVTNREKLRRFIESELFPAWGLRYAATFYWLKIKADGSLIGELDLFHHRPYECLLLGYSIQQDADIGKLPGHKPLPNNQVFISVPGDYSRKPPLGDMLLEYAPSCGDTRCLELFARELSAGRCCWGNETLRFQDRKYFSTRGNVRTP
ncbi:OLC1v1017890C1 [Oldenlandia corymbosa var. corymbosa]|uniref:OLC1v1017890C1 n=1 Tax=Oldenlandia corymbosa var. corymbosa TaxID=529605 RepID=A0AAV1EAR4_OLDCO|nr:OLC1v1017890C1 [Oldenlandia corymbosa var. corymbosa]